MTAQITSARFRRMQFSVYGILLLSYISVYFHRTAMTVVAGELMQTFTTTSTQLGWLVAIFHYVYAVMQIPAGVLADRMGVRVITAIGALVAGGGSILFGFAPNFFCALAGRFFIGLGLSFGFVGLMRANTAWFSEARYGFISGLTLMLGNVGAVLATAPLAALLAIISWRTVFVAWGIFLLITAILTFVFVRNSPEDAGFPPLRENSGKSAHASSTQHWLRDFADVLRNRAIWPGFWASFGMVGSYAAVVGLWGIPFLRDVRHLSRAEASFYTGVSVTAFAIGALVLGLLSDRLRRRKPILVVTTAASTLAWLAFMLLPQSSYPSEFLMYAYGLLGFCTGGCVISYSAATEVVPQAIAGMAVAVVNTGIFLGAAVVQSLFGLLIDLTWDGTIIEGIRHYRLGDYTNGLWLCFGVTMISFIASLCMQETYCRNIAVKR